MKMCSLDFSSKNMIISRLFLAVIGTLISLHSAAQVSLTNPLITNGDSFVVSERGSGNQSDPVPIPANGAGTNTLTFEVTLYRPVNFNTGGYVSIHAGKSSSNYSPTEIAVTSTVDNSLWTNADDGRGNLSSNYEQQILTGAFTGSAYVVNDNTGFFAIYHDNSNNSILVSSQVYLQVLPPDYSENPLSTYIPFPDKEIGPNQCVPYGDKPTIQGRILAGNWGGTFLNGTGWDSDFARYTTLCNNLGITPFARDSEDERITWQYSYDMNNWTNLYSDFPYGNLVQAYAKPITQVTYFRRVSTHREPSFWSSQNRAWWYTSNVVTISPTAPVPSTNQTAFKTCGNSVTVSVNADPAIASYNWSAPYDGWTISDGIQAPFSTYNNVSSFVTTKSSNIVIQPPSNAAPGDYVVSFSANGSCGTQSADNRLIITIDHSGTSAPTSGYFNQANSDYCNPTYDLYTSPVAGATSYEATLDDGSRAQGYYDPNIGVVVFSFGIVGPVYRISAQIVAIGSCGASSAYFMNPQNLSGPPISCGSYQSNVKAYPNPAINVLNIEAKSDGSICYIYNDQGIVIRTISLDKGGARQSVDVSTIPNGLYNIVIKAPNRKPSVEHIVVQH